MTTNYSIFHDQMKIVVLMYAVQQIPLYKSVV